MIIMGLLMILSSLGASDLPPDIINFKRYAADEGLANLVVYDIVQDSDGFIWISTGKGISRFDGYEFKNYLPDKNDPNSIGNGPAIDIFIDSRERMWISVISEGLYLYEKHEDHFIAYKHDPEREDSLSSDNPYSIAEDNDGNIWIATFDKGLNLLDEENGSFTHIKHDPDNMNSLSSDQIFAIVVDSFNVLWISTVDGGLCLYDIDENSFYNPIKKINQSVAITETANGDMWIPTIGSGLVRYNRSTDDYVYYLTDESDEMSISHNTLIRVIEDKYGTVWISTWGRGIDVYDPDTDGFINYSNDPRTSASLSSNDTWGIFEDKTGVLWVGTYGSGINRYDRKTERFSRMLQKIDDPNSLSNNNVKSVLEDSNGDLWIGTLGGGVNHYDRNKDLFTLYKNEIGNTDSLSNDNVWMLSEDQNGYVWIATENGLNRLDVNTGNIARYLEDQLVRSVLVDSRNRVWVGTQFNGISLYDRSGNSFFKYQTEGIYNNCIFEDSMGIIWFGNVSGLHYFDEKSREIERSLEDPLNSGTYFDKLIVAINEDRNNDLWVGSTTELIRLSRETGSMKEYTVQDGLIDDAIAGLITDYTGKLWISTSKGISVYQPVSDSFKNYPIGAFNRSANALDVNEELYFGSFNGLVHFKPEEITDNLILPPVVITSFKIFNKEVRFDFPIWDMRALKLSYKDNFFSFEFAALDYSNPPKNQYRYKLAGFDTDRIDVTSKRRFAGYTNLDGGEYTFKVIASNSDGVWNNLGVSLPVHISSPFIETDFFKILLTLMILIVSGAIAFYIYKLLVALKKQRAAEDENIGLRNYLGNIIDSMPSVLVGVDSQCQVTIWNNTAEKVTGINSTSARGKLLEDVFPHLRDEINNIKDSIRKRESILDTKRERLSDSGKNFEDLTIYPLISNGVEGAVIRIDDVTELVQMEELMIQSEKMMSIGGLASGMAHEINNPLAVCRVDKPS